MAHDGSAARKISSAKWVSAVIAHAEEFARISDSLICICSAEGYLTDFSSYWTETLGWTTFDLCSRPLTEFVHPDDRDMAMINFETLKSHAGPLHFEHRWMRKSGGSRLLAWSAEFSRSKNLVFAHVRDVTEERGQQLKLNQIEQVSGIGSWEIDLLSKQLTWSAATHKIHDTDPSTFKPALEDGLRFFHPDSVLKITRAVNELMVSGTPYDLELKLITAKQREIWVRCMARAEIKAGNLQRAYGTIQDITDVYLKRKADEQTAFSLLELNERLNLVLDGAKLGYWDWWLNSNDIVFDRRWCEMIGVDEGDPGLTVDFWMSRIHPEDQQRCSIQLSETLVGSSDFFQCVYRMRHEHGHWVWILNRGKISARNSEGKPVRFSGTHLDISEFKRLEHELHEKNDKLQALVESLDDVVYEVSPDGKVLDAFCSDLSLLPAAKNKLHQRSLVEIYPDPVGQQLLNIVAACGGPMGSIEQSMDFETHDGAGVLKWFRARARRIGLQGNRISLMISDIADLKAAQLSLVQSAKMASLGEMAGGIAHEINNPLGIILGKVGYLQMMIEDGPIDNARILLELEKIASTAERIAKIVRGLRTFSRTGEKDPIENVSLARILHETLELCQERFRNHGVELRYTAVDPKLIIACRGVQISQTLLNLLNNAFDAVATCDDKWVEIQVERTAHAVKILVIDSGAGIPPDVAARIMTPFFTTKEVGVGTGLGLSISKGIVADHGGQLFLDVLAKNTTFVVELPLTPEKA